MNYRGITNEDTCVKVYNPVDKSVIGVYDNYDKASVDLGISWLQVFRRCADKERVHIKRFKIDVAVRLSKRTPDTAVTNHNTYLKIKI